MRNTWVQSKERKSVCRQMDEQSESLRLLYDSDREGFKRAVGRICQATLDEVLGGDPCGVIGNVIDKVCENPTWPLFDCVVRHALDELEALAEFC